MKKIGIYIFFIIFITVFMPMILVQGYKIAKNDTNINEKEKGKNKNRSFIAKDIDFKDTTKIKVYNEKTKKVEEIGLEEYVVGVVSSEMPAAFHEEALKAQAVAARTYAISRVEKFKNGHPDHPQAPLCTGVHCQAWMSKEELKQVHGDKWMEEYWGKLQAAVNDTKGELITYNGQLISEPLFHSTSGGKTEASEEVFAAAHPYLKSVTSPYEEEAPKFKSVITMTFEEFIKKIKGKYPKVNITKENVTEKIKVSEKTSTGRIKKLVIDGNTIDGTVFRNLFGLNSTNFKINLSKDNIKIQTLGYGHGVGMSQWGANGMGKNGKNYKEILKHYYTGVDIKKY
ncbi:stage II sporulation protein D [Gottschalkia purinilytica]|uniref:Stage II sporulation protein D n=1 Tax=Gottschalkia purinilytica TaxID=1503 RepID=A0A0L0WE56_GOTPU|nr:stage II sporulation protein D [Gottschalkia purinilytica]KNF09705.1 stage II sporulation protein D [Gottschalkia purinilytica]